MHVQFHSCLHFERRKNFLKTYNSVVDALFIYFFASIFFCCRWCNCTIKVCVSSVFSFSFFAIVWPLHSVGRLWMFEFGNVCVWFHLFSSKFCCPYCHELEFSYDYFFSIWVFVEWTPRWPQNTIIHNTVSHLLLSFHMYFRHFDFGLALVVLLKFFFGRV